MNEVITFDWVDDETCDIYLDGVHVGKMDHGAHGWDGMIGIRDVVTNIADALGYRIQIIGEEAV